MAHITLEVSQPVHQSLIQQAQEVKCSPERWLQQHLSEAFGIAIPTSDEARAKGQSVLHQYTGIILRAEAPTFDEAMFQWRVPVFPNLQSEKRTPVGELRFDAKTGELHTDREAIDDMVEKVKSLIGIQRLPGEVRQRMEELSDRADAGALNSSEQKELVELAEQWLHHALENVKRFSATIDSQSTGETP